MKVKYWIAIVFLIFCGLGALALHLTAFFTEWWIRVPDSSVKKLMTAEHDAPADHSIIELTHPLPYRRGLYTDCTKYLPMKLEVAKNFSMPYNERTYSAKKQKKCADRGMMYCASGVKNTDSELCYNHDKHCNRIADCNMAEDEHNCKPITDVEQEKFLCKKYNYEIDRSQVGNGINDCLDWTDETGVQCDASVTIDCDFSKGFKYCKKGARCDGIPDCLDYSDELNCEKQCTSATMIECDGRCFNSEKARCDGVSQCSSMVDEMDCKPERSKETQKVSSVELDEKHQCMKKYFNIHNAETVSLDHPMPQSRQKFTNKMFYLRLSQIVLFSAAALWMIIGVSILPLTMCCRRCLVYPVVIFSLMFILAFLCMGAGLGTFLYEFFWSRDNVHQRENVPEHEALINKYNPQILYSIKLGLSFWLMLASFLLTLFITLCSCTIYSRLPTRPKNDEYEIVQMNSYT
ncbi:hypothetical protein SNEBB_008679 [Seison nebaliae]|nr:hypothetical protein SNEBB_008679 [Seison nebaliae]